MTLETFEDLLDRHGGAIETWPSEMQARARDLVAASAEARAALAALQRIETLLRAEPEPLGATAFAARAVARPQLRPASHTLRVTAWTAAALAVLAIGLVVGHEMPIRQDPLDRVLTALVDLPGPSDVD